MFILLGNYFLIQNATVKLEFLQVVHAVGIFFFYESLQKSIFYQVPEWFQEFD